MKEYWVYMLHCNDGTYYTGITNSVTKRLWQHQNAVHPNSYTAQRLPVELVYSSMFNDVWEAIRWEKILKDWRREKKEALIRGEYEIIAKLAASKKTPADSSLKKSSRSARTDNEERGGETSRAVHIDPKRDARSDNTNT